MAVVSKIATLRMDDAVTHADNTARTWVATAAVQDTAAGSSVNITITMTAGAGAPVVASALTLEMLIDNSATNIKTFTLTPGLASQSVSFFFSATGNSPSGGNERCGIVRLNIHAVNTVGLAANQYDVNSDGTANTPPTGFHVHQADKGWIRGTTTSTVVVNKTSLGSAAFTGTYAYPDSLFMSTTLGARAYDTAKTITNNIAGVVAQTNATSDGDADKRYDSTFTNKVLAANFSVGSTSRLASVTALQSSNLVAATDWTVLTQTTQTLTVDPRLTFTSVSRTSSRAVVLYGFDTVTGTFNVQNARSENLSSVTHGAFATLTLRSKDIIGGGLEKTISASLAPSTTTYSISHAFAAPTATRGVNTAGDTAAHDTTGKTKGFHAFPNSDTTNTFTYTTTFVALSDLLRLDVHPQNNSTLMQDSDPYVNPGDGEDINYVISADTLSMFSFVGHVDGTGLSGIDVKMALFDPSDNQSGTEQTKATQSAGNLGWTTSAASFAIVAPAGSWKVRSLVDFNHSGANGNYGNAATTVGITVIGSLTQTISFNSAYTANRFIAIQHKDQYAAGEVADIYVQYINTDGTRLALDTEPSIRIYSVNSDGTEFEGAPLTVMTAIGNNAYLFTWDIVPFEFRNYVIEIRAQKDGGGVQGASQCRVHKYRLK